MPDRELYTLSIPANAQTLNRSEIQRNLATHGLLDEGTASVESLSLDPNQELLRGQFRGRYARLMAQEVEELFDASGIEAVPFYDPSGSKEDAYYALENVDVEALDPNLDELREFDGVLTKTGTRSTHYRVISTNVRQADHPWGNTLEARVGIPGSAGKVRWYDPVTEQTEPASSVARHAAEVGEVALFDVADGESALGVENPSLLYDVPYEREGRSAPVVWDDHGREKLDEDGVNSWQWVFSTSHEFAGQPVLDTGRLRLRLDESSEPSLSADRWDDTAGAWTASALNGDDADSSEAVVGDAVVGSAVVGGSSTANEWTLYDIDITDISLSTITLQLEFQHPDEGLYNLNAVVAYGRDAVLFDRVDDGPVPTGLERWLEPVAADWLMDPQQQRTLVSRREVRA